MGTKNLVSITQAAGIIGVSRNTLRRWEAQGKISPSRSEGNHRRYLLSDLRKYTRQFDTSCVQKRTALIYARVSSADQKEDLERQKKLLELFCASKGISYEIIEDVGSGINYKKKGLQKVITYILEDKIDRLVLTHKDRLLRFGAELIFSLCAAKNVAIEILNKTEDSTFEEDLAKDVLEIITVFSAKLYGSRSHKNKKLIKELQEITLAHTSST